MGILKTEMAAVKTEIAYLRAEMNKGKSLRNLSE
jgi:hypothetical protein